MRLTDSILIVCIQALSHFLLWLILRILCLDESWIIIFNILIIRLLLSDYLRNCLKPILVFNLKTLYI